MPNKSKNDVAWIQIFEKYDILNHIEDDGQFYITSNQIKEFREPRLMTKFDNNSQLPELFRKYKLSILPLTRGSYSISNYEIFHKIEEIDTPVIDMPYPSYLQSIEWNNITSESTAINVAYISDMLSDFLDEEDLLPTVNGRMGSKKFKYFINNKRLKISQEISVRNSQIEIDGGFEGYHSLSLVEAKNILSTDFLVRQLYYPYRLWSSQIDKPVRSIYLTYSDNIFTFYEYEFVDPYHYNSLELIRADRYALMQDPISIDDIMSIYNNVRFVEEDQEIPFVQADSFYRIINLVELIKENGAISPTEIAEAFGFAKRQSDYYYNAGRYIGLFQKIRTDEGVKVDLTLYGEKLTRIPTKNRNLKLVERILQHKVFHEVLGIYLRYNDFPDDRNYMKIMKKYPLNIGNGEEAMYKRRSSSITGWIKWIFSLIR